ncbi:DUF2188 domain-containing protein [uncultured Cellulomonas sp.]|uniref:DUF2188 domain-containing protein n=1 Tax=uncultured Cellulomonas sp. TaxID=189682 RepID=UPI0028E1D6AC|nr:DUF2188 domain-containing protein [uncultured Cellulomonas sp.]
MSHEVHTVSRDGLWINEVEGEPVDGGFLSKDDALAAGRDAAAARGVEHVVDDGD